MSTKSDRDAAVDRLLRTSLRGNPDGVDAECLSADALAAFVEGSLASVENDAAEAHLAACGKCQDALAALAEMPEIGPANTRKERPAWAGLRWLVPASVVLTALVIYVAIKTVEAPGVPVSQTTVTLASKVDEQAVKNFAPRSEAAPAQAARLTEVPPQAAAARATVRPKQELRLDASKPLRGAPPATLMAQNAPAAQPPRQVAADAVEVKGEPPAAAPQTTLATVKALPPPAVVEQVNAAGKAAAAPPPTMAKAAMPSAPAVDLKQQRVGAVAESVALTAEGGGVLVVRSSDGLARWHVDSRGLVSRSVDNGLSWQPALTGTSRPILAVSSPAATIAWAVGRGGTVARTTDGERWARCTFPEAVDLVAVDAKDGVTATVTTRDGRKFTTPDGGATWMLAR